MMSAKKTMLSFGKVLTYILLLLFALGVIGFFALFTNGFTDDFKTFYVEYDGQKFLKADNECALPNNQDLRFDVKYTFDAFQNNAEPKGYTLKVVPCKTEKVSFDFTVDGDSHSFADETDLTAAFDITLYDDYFTLSLSQDMTMQTVLQSLYGGETVQVPDTVNLYNDCYFSLFVSSYNDASSVSIDFCIYVPVTGINMDRDGIVL